MAVLYGALGGGIVEAVVFYSRISAWQNVRHAALDEGLRELPSARAFIDPLSDVAAAITRFLLGAGAGWLFHTQITGVYAAVAVGSSAPSLLRQLGSSENIRKAVHGGGPMGNG